MSAARMAGAMVLAGALLAGTIAPAAAEDLVFRPKSPTVGTAPGKAPATPQASGSKPWTCALVTVEASPLTPKGTEWDTVGGDPPPDIQIEELTSGASAYCKSQFRCQLRLAPGKDALSFVVEDKDVLKKNDLIGRGQCRLGDRCALPPAAHVSIARC